MVTGPGPVPMSTGETGEGGGGGGREWESWEGKRRELSYRNCEEKNQNELSLQFPGCLAV